MKAHHLLIAAFASLGLQTSTVALAQDAATANSATVTVKLDNPNVRVLESTLKPGEKENIHSHPASVIYVIAGGKVRNHFADGKAVDSELTAGAVIYREPLTHWAENIGTTPIHLIITEIKDPK
jgi:quercetin dioxygenase-like cupin family protein